MKTIYTIVLFFFSFAIALSQADKRFVNDEFHTPKSKKAEIQSNDDYLVESVKVHSKQYGESKYTYTYDANGNMISELGEIWENDEWINFSRTTYTYDGNLIKYLYEEWEKEEWVNVERYTQTYDDKGNIITELLERWINKKWANHSRHTYTYNEDGNRLIYLYEFWSHTYEEFVNGFKWTSTYDDDGNFLTWLDEIWENDEWVNSRRFTKIYDDGNPYTVKEKWENEDWVYYERVTHTRGEYGNLLTYLSEEWVNNEWVNNWILTYTYDDYGNCLTYLNEIWEKNKWVNNVRYAYTYDSDGNLLIFFSEICKNDEWVESDGNCRFEDSNGNSYGFYRGYKIEVTWKITSVENESGDSFSIISFPNPFTNSTTIKYTLTEPGIVRLNFYDNLGNKIKKKEKFQEAGEHQEIFNAENYTKGVYYYTIQIGQQIKSGKLLLIR